MVIVNDIPSFLCAQNMLNNNYGPLSRATQVFFLNYRIWEAAYLIWTQLSGITDPLR